MCTCAISLVGMAFPVLGFCTFLWTIVHGAQKIESALKFMQVEVEVKCMETKFGGRGFSSFRDFAPFCLPSKRPKFPFGPWTVHGGQKKESASKIHASRGWAWKPILVGVASPVSEILPHFVYLQNGQNFLSDHGLLYIVHGDQKIASA